MYADTCFIDFRSDEENISIFEHFLDAMENGPKGSRGYNFKKALEFWEHCPAVQAIWNYVENAYRMIDRFVRRVGEVIKQAPQKVKRAVRRAFNDSIIWADGAEKVEDGHEQFYLIRLINSDGELVWSKIGTTARSTEKRMKEHLRAYSKYDITKIIIDRVWDCGNQQAEAYESIFRAHYMTKHPGTWRKNDRFTGVLFDLEEAEQMFENFRKMQTI